MNEINFPSIATTQKDRSQSVNCNITKDQIVVDIRTEGPLTVRFTHFWFLSQKWKSNEVQLTIWLRERWTLWTISSLSSRRTNHARRRFEERTDGRLILSRYFSHISFDLRADSCIIKSPNSHKRDNKKFYDKIDVDKSTKFLRKYMENYRQSHAANDRRNLVVINDDHRNRNEKLFWVRWCEHVTNTHFQ